DRRVGAGGRERSAVDPRVRRSIGGERRVGLGVGLRGGRVLRRRSVMFTGRPLVRRVGARTVQGGDARVVGSAVERRVVAARGRHERGGEHEGRAEKGLHGDDGCLSWTVCPVAYGSITPLLTMRAMRAETP